MMAGPEISKAVLVTGCSSGIGKATALRLVRDGWTVYATARRLTDLADLAAAGARTLALDVTDEESMRAAVAAIEAAEGAVGVLVNNAGYSQSGAVESVTIDRVRRQFETNVFGTVRLTQLVLPGMRRQRWGRVVNLSSMGGKLTFPGGGFYHGTKYAIEAITDALRFEVAGFGIDAILIEPGLIKSGFAEAAAVSVDAPAGASDPYASFNAAVVASTRAAYESGPLAALGGTPETVAATIARAIAARKPRSRYTVTPSANVLIGLRRLLPDALWDGFLASQFARPR
jgi:NAD(P)-dependent dehydrogenase (short-subunit alcohol dehydrogenase family)